MIQMSSLLCAAFFGVCTPVAGAAVMPQVNTPSETVTARGVIKAAREAEVSVAVSARIASMPYSPGERFNKGAVLARFDCSRIKAELEALEAARGALETTARTSKELFDYGAAGQLELDKANADVVRADAEARAKKAQLSDCAIYAPYAGYVVERHVQPFETPSAGAPLMKIMDDAPREIKLIAPSRWLRWLEPGAAFTFTVDETGASYPAKVIRVGQSVDSVSRTIELTARFDGQTPGAIAGMSGAAAFEVAETE